jgi:class 3 adenylate cyclase/HAMP domain-containing protein
MGCNKDFYRDQWGTFLSCYIPLIDYDKNFLGVLALDFDSKSQYNQLQKIKIYFVLLGLMIAIIIFFSFYEISSYLLKPIKKLTRASIEVANRNYHVKLYTFSNDELGILTKNFNRMVQEIKDYVERIEFIVDSFSRFVPKHFANILQKESILDVKPGDATEKDLAILFNDIKNFSTLAEMLSVKETFEFLNTYFEIMSPIILKYKGFIDKFIGDEIMALFDCNPDFLLDAAIEMRLRLKEFNEKIKHLNLPTVDMGIGIHYGKVVLGTVGSQERLDTTVVGDTVNTASRIQQLTRVFKTPILITDSVKEKLKNIDKYYLRKLQKVRVKGKKEPVQIYECFNVDSDEQIEKKLQTLQKFEEAIEFIHNKKIQDAIVLLKEIYQINPEDIVVQVYLERYERLNSQYQNI